MAVSSESVFLPERQTDFRRGYESPIQYSGISKIITLAVALEICGFDQVFKKVGMEPTGDPFNSLMKLENTDSSPTTR